MGNVPILQGPTISTFPISFLDTSQTFEGRSFGTSLYSPIKIYIWQLFISLGKFEKKFEMNTKKEHSFKQILLNYKSSNFLKTTS